MHNTMASQPLNGGEAKDPIDPIEQAARASEDAAVEFAEGVSRAKDAVEAASDRAMRAGVELMQRNAETMQHALHCGARLAARMSERSADRLGCSVGMAGQSADNAALKSSRNCEAVVHAGTVLTQIAQRLCEEWADMARARMDRGFDRIDAFLQCRTPQDLVALQSEVMRDNIETLVAYARKAGEHSARLAAEADAAAHQ
jgi:hypothetical protein